MDCSGPGKIKKGQKCLNCDGSCKKCQAESDKDQCTECYTGKFLDMDQTPSSCVACDSPGEIQDAPFCLRCHDSCSQCSVVNDINSCTQCKDPNQILEGETGPSKCVDCSGDGLIKFLNRCRNCHNTCKILIFYS